MKKISIQMIASLVLIGITINAFSEESVISKEWQHIELAEKIRKEEIAPLHLENKNVLSAIDVLVSQGFYCGIEMLDPKMGELSLPPGIQCIMRSSKHKDCEELRVNFWSDWKKDEQLSSIAEKLKSSNLTEGPVTFCGKIAPVSQEYLKKKNQANEILSRRIEDIGLKSNSKSFAAKKMIGIGFKCGFSSAESADPVFGKKQIMICVKHPSTIDFCDEESVVLSIFNGSSERGLFSDENSAFSKVDGITSDCVIRKLKTSNAR